VKVHHIYILDPYDPMLRRTVRSLDRQMFGASLLLFYRALRARVPQRAWQVNCMSRQPVFVGGCGRSGTTMMLSLLSAHPSLYAIPYETHAFAPGPYPPDGDSGLPFELVHLHTALLQPTESLEGRSRWCEKTPGNIHFVDRILKYFGADARFIHMVRDGRAVVTSRHRHHAPERYWVAPERWIRDVAAGRHAETHPQVLTVRYEDVVDDYKGVMRTVCRFIEEPFAPEAFTSYPATAKVLKTRDGQDKPPRPIRASPEERWRDEEHAKVVQRLLRAPKAQDHLVHYGYR